MLFRIKWLRNSIQSNNLSTYEEILGFASVLIRTDKNNIAIALTAYVEEGPNVQYDAQAVNAY